MTTVTVNGIPFTQAGHQEQEDALKDLLEGVDNDTLRYVFSRAPQDKQEAAAEGVQDGLSGISGTQRKSLYALVIWALAILAFLALAGGGVALMFGKEGAAAFFSFAGSALGGITALFIPSPVAKNT